MSALAAFSDDNVWCGGVGARGIRTRIIRGGSSKGVFLRSSEVEDLPDFEGSLLRLFGSPDPRQIDGLGGADKLTSKLAIMGSSSRLDCDIDYKFGQVSIELPKIDWQSNCGNIAAGAALFAAFDGKGRLDDDGRSLQIAIHQRNTGRRLLARVPVESGRPKINGEFKIGGVPGTGAKLELDFLDFAGSCLGGDLLPLGPPVSKLVLSCGRRLLASVIDMANLHVFVRAEAVGIDMQAPLFKLQADLKLLERLEDIRFSTARATGFYGEAGNRQLLQVTMNPLLHVVAPPQSYNTISGIPIASNEIDLRAISFARGAFSKAFPGSGAVAAGVAAAISGTLPNIQSQSLVQGKLRIGHPSGVLETNSDVIHGTVLRAELGRTARLLLDGMAFI